MCIYCLQGPYYTRDEPEMCRRDRSIFHNPVVADYGRFISFVDDKVEKVKSLEAREFVLESPNYYRYREWFPKLMSDYRVHADFTRESQIRALSEVHVSQAEREKIIVLQASLEVTCSLILFCRDERYEKMQDRDVERLRFPLSRMTRDVIFSLKIDGDRLSFNSYLMD
jgi:hypothetical protein